MREALFGLGDPASSFLEKKRKKQRKRERKARRERALAQLATDRVDVGNPEIDFGIPAHLLADVYVPISEKVKMGRRKRVPTSQSPHDDESKKESPSTPPAKKVKQCP